MKEIKRFKVHVPILTKTKKKGKLTDAFEDFVHYYSGVGNDTRAATGVTILIKKYSGRTCIFRR